MRAVTPTSNWSPRTTVPREFKLGTSREGGVTPVRSLQRPAQRGVLAARDEEASPPSASRHEHHSRPPAQQQVQLPGKLLPPSMWQ
jgi:hypothetical protein